MKRPRTGPSISYCRSLVFCPLRLAHQRARLPKTVALGSLPFPPLPRHGSTCSPCEVSERWAGGPVLVCTLGRLGTRGYSARISPFGGQPGFVCACLPASGVPRLVRESKLGTCANSHEVLTGFPPYHRTLPLSAAPSRPAPPAGRVVPKSRGTAGYSTRPTPSCPRTHPRPPGAIGHARLQRVLFSGPWQPTPSAQVTSDTEVPPRPLDRECRVVLLPASLEGEGYPKWDY